MVQSVELVLDPDLEAGVRQEWAALATAGLAGQADHPSPTNRPHITLAVGRRAWPAATAEVLPGALAALPLEVRLGGLVLFAHRDRAVLARLVVPSRELLALQAEVGETLLPLSGGPEEAPAHLAPGTWTPHVTLARRLPTDQVGSALQALAGMPVERVGRVTVARWWDGDRREIRWQESFSDRGSSG